MKNYIKKFGSYCILVIIILFLFTLIAPEKASLFFKEGIIWIAYYLYITIGGISKCKIYIGYTIAVVLTILVISSGT